VHKWQRAHFYLFSSLYWVKTRWPAYTWSRAVIRHCSGTARLWRHIHNNYHAQPLVLPASRASGRMIFLNQESMLWIATSDMDLGISFPGRLMIPLARDSPRGFIEYHSPAPYSGPALIRLALYSDIRLQSTIWPAICLTVLQFSRNCCLTIDFHIHSPSRFACQARDHDEIILYHEY